LCKQQLKLKHLTNKDMNQKLIFGGFKTHSLTFAKNSGICGRTYVTFKYTPGGAE